MNRKTFPLGAALASPISRTTVLQERLAALGELPFSKMGARLGAEAEGLEDGWGNGFFVTSVSRSVRMCGRTHETIWLRLARQFPLRFATRIHHGVMALQPLLLGFITRSLSPLPRLSELSTHKVTVNFSKVPRDEKCEEIVKQRHPTFESPRIHAVAHSQ